jgi:hypothetical protein
LKWKRQSQKLVQRLFRRLRGDIQKRDFHGARRRPVEWGDGSKILAASIDVFKIDFEWIDFFEKPFAGRNVFPITERGRGFPPALDPGIRFQGNDQDRVRGGFGIFRGNLGLVGDGPCVGQGQGMSFKFQSHGSLGSATKLLLYKS